MTTCTTSVAMTADLAQVLRAHVDRPDGQEDICLATYRPSTGATRATALVTSVITPLPGEREVHGNASIIGDYVLRAAVVAHARGDGLVLCHSHPGSHGWQLMSGPDFNAEHSFANLTRELIGHPLVGMTYSGGDQSWSARHWDRGAGLDVSATHCDNVRVIGECLDVSWNNELVPPAAATGTQRRSVSCWGPAVHSNLVRRKVLVVGAGSVGLDIAVRLAATGMIQVTVMDFDTVELGNLDRLIGATPHDAMTGRAKIQVAERLMRSAATSTSPAFAFYDLSVCEPEGLAIALDQDLIISCVDRPWARIVLNQIAYTDLVPVIDGGISIDVFDDGKGMRNAMWRSHVLRPGRPCLVCNDQVNVSDVSLDIQGLLDDPTYIAGARRESGGENVALLSVSATASLLAQFVSFNVAPGGIGEPGPLQYLLSTHTLEHLGSTTRPGCPYEHAEAVGDARQALTGEHPAAQEHRVRRARSRGSLLYRWLDRLARWLWKRVDRRVRRQPIQRCPPMANLLAPLFCLRDRDLAHPPHRPSQRDPARAAAEILTESLFAGVDARDNRLVMTSPAERHIWENHPLWHDRARLDAIRKQMWIEVQKTMFPGKPRRPLRNPRRTELTVVGGTSAEDANSEAIHTLLQYQPSGEVDWEALGNTVAHRRGVAAVRKARKHRKLPDGSEITMASLDIENDDGAPLVNEIADDDLLPDEEATERVLRAERLVALRTVADGILPQRDRDIVFRIARGETTVAIAEIVNLTPQRVGQVYRESLRKVNAQLRTDPKFRRLYETEGGTPNG